MREFKTSLLAAASGVLFALGLGISGMTSPDKVLAFLELGGAWDPQLAFVMAGALAVYAPAYVVYKRIGHTPILEDACSVPTARGLDRKLLIGAGLFGIGWGLAGYCPGPALTSLAAPSVAVVAFVVAMLIGMVLVRRRR